MMTFLGENKAGAFPSTLLSLVFPIVVGPVLRNVTPAAK
jgi:hypothetical protein